jgi:hypothetical protein
MGAQREEGMSEQIDIFKCLDFIRDHASKYAQAKANRVYCEEYRKTLKAQLMKRHVDSPVTAQEREAYADEAYANHLEALQVAVEEEERLRWLIEGAKLKVSVWQSLGANQRAEAKAL